jgi:CheY-like chemotaxis protein
MLVEDNAGDVRLTREALREGRVRNNLSVAKDGVEAMAMLRREPEYADLPRPDLVLLDLNLPRMDGRKVLAAIKGDPDLRRIPVVVLTTSKAVDRRVLAHRRDLAQEMSRCAPGATTGSCWSKIILPMLASCGKRCPSIPRSASRSSILLGSRRL